MKSKTFTIELEPGFGGKPDARFPGRIIDMEDVELLIEALGRFRGLAEPASDDLPAALDVQTDAPFEVSNSMQGVVLAIRDRRFGWLGYAVDQVKITKLVDDFRAEVEAEQADKDGAH